MDRASVDRAALDLAQPSRLRVLGALGPLAALVLVGIGALAFDLTLPLRLPDSADWAEAAGRLRALGRPGDAVQLWPAWAERGRLFVDAMPVLTEEDLAAAEYVGVARLWLLSLPHAPRAGLERAEAALRARGAEPQGAPERFGALRLQAWELRMPPLAADLTGQGRPLEAHEVDYVARRCLQLPIGLPQNPSRVRLVGAAGAVLHLRAGVVGERAYDDRPPVHLEVRADGAFVLALEVPRTTLREHGWRAADAPLPPGKPEREFELIVSSPDPQRPFCAAAWTTQR